MTDIGERLRGFEEKKKVMWIGVGLCYICGQVNTDVETTQYHR